MTTQFVSNQEFRDATPGLDLSKYTETTLSGVLTRATARAERYIEYTLPFEVITGEKMNGTIDAHGDLTIFPRKKPIRSIDAVSIVKGPFNASLSISNRTDIPTSLDRVTIDSHTVIISEFLSIDFYHLREQSFYVKVDYSAGFYMYDRPQDIIDAIILYARDEVARSFNPVGASEIKQGAVTIKYNTSSISGGRKATNGKSDLILDAEAILTTYKRVVGW